MFYKDAGAAVLVYDITSDFTFEELKNYWAEQIKESAPQDIILAIAANKSDLSEQEKVDEDEARKLANDLGAIFCSTSAKNSHGIDDLFLQIAKKHTGTDVIELKNEDDDYSIPSNQDEKELSKKGSIKITENSFKEEKKKKCC